MHDEMKRAIQEELETYLRMVSKPSPAAGKNMWDCPKCGSGKGKNHTGALHVYRDKGALKFKCHQCEIQGDIFDLVGILEGITDNRQKIEKAAEILHLPSPFSFPAYKVDKTIKESTEMSHNDTPKEDTAPKTNYIEFFKEAAEHITEIDNHRGISLETLRRYNIGYVKEWRPPKVPTAPASPRIIIPTSEYTYVARHADINAEKGERYRKVGEIEIFNAAAIDESENPIFVVEGELDALSIIDGGGEAVSLGSTSNVNKFINHVSAGHRPKHSFIIALDNDEPGRAAAYKLKTELEGINVPCFLDSYLYGEGGLCGEYKDANEFLMGATKNGTRNIFSEKVMSAKKKIGEAYQKEYSNSAYMKPFLWEIKTSMQRPPISTGFPLFDKALTEGIESPIQGEGLNVGLYVIGAESSVGKTTFVLQIADQIASMSTAAEAAADNNAPVPAGIDVLIFSLEMSREELIAKTISRYTLEYTQQEILPKEMAKSVSGILVGRRWKKYDDSERAVITAATKRYDKETMRHIYVVEGNGETGLAEIRKKIAEHTAARGRAPVVVIDYLQIMAPPDIRATDKQNTDKTIKELRQMARDFKTPILAISSFNRDSYDKDTNMKAFKESGSIEYSADVLISLQLYGVGKMKEGHKITTEEQKNKDPREVIAKVIKNRNGKPGDKAKFFYYPVFNCFQETNVFSTTFEGD